MFGRREDEACNEYEKAKVINACKKTLLDIRSGRDAIHEKDIQREMRKQRFFFGRKFTRTEAIDRLKTLDGVFCQWDMTECTFGLQEYEVNRILDAANGSKNDTFWLTKTEFGYLNWEK